MKETELLYRCLYALVIFGIGEVISSSVMGEIVDYLNYKNFCFVNILTWCITVAFTIWNIIKFKFDSTTYVTCLLWGISDGSANVHLNSICGSEFEDIAMAFGGLNFM